MARLECGAGRAPRQVICRLLARRPQVWLPSRVRLHLSTPLGNSEHAVGAAPPSSRGGIRPGSWPHYRPIPDGHTQGDTYQPDGCRPKGPHTRKVAFNHRPVVSQRRRCQLLNRRGTVLITVHIGREDHSSRSPLREGRTPRKSQR